jgi:hypothetical protein
MDACRDLAATDDPILVFDAFGPIGFVMKFAAEDWEVATASPAELLGDDDGA